MSPLKEDSLAQPFYEYGLKPFGVALFFVLVALLWTFLLQHWMEYPFVFLFVAAIMGSAWFGGRIAGFFAVVLSSFLVTYFFIPPLYSIKVAQESESFLAAFVLFALTVSILSSTQRQSEKNLRESRDVLEMKVQERTAELERSSREALQSERQLRLLMEAIHQQIWRADPLGGIEYLNQHLREYLGAIEEDLDGDRLFGAVHPQDADQVNHAWRHALRTGEAFEVEARVRNAEGGYRWFLIRGFPQRSDSGEILRWYGLHIDIEERQRAQQSITARHESVSQASRNLSMSELAASIAHELNQPMTALVTHAYACLEWARTEPPNLEKVSATSEKIVQESTKASAVVKRIRSLFSKDDLIREEHDLNLLIEDAAWLLRDEAIRESVRIDLQLGRELKKVEIDPVQVQQVVINLAKNAIEAMANWSGERTVTISTEKGKGNEILARVRDTGPGIDPKLTQYIFDPFYSTKRNGTGIGLAICRSIVEAHSGRIWVENGANGGAMFYFTIPTTA
jgi:PAS domain S-box-containing protein